MNTRKMPKMSGIALALAAAGLMVGCAGNANSASSVVAASGSTDLIHCSGVNKCSGHNDCGTAKNSCAGKASCKGTGFVSMPSKACADIGGNVEPNWKGVVAKSDLAQCYGVNKCGGHNDCKTSENACAGKGSCKGTGFVAMGKKACDNVGGNQGS